MNPLPIQLVTHGPVALGARWWRSADDIRVTLVAKLTFRLVHASVAEIVNPEPVLASDRWASEGALIAASELAPHLPRAEVILFADACATSDVPVQRARVRLRLVRGEDLSLDKVLFVTGRRKPDGTLEPFLRRSLGFEPSPHRADAGPMPLSVVDPQRPGDPAGYGPIPPTWPARADLLVGGSNTDVEGDMPRLPPAFDMRYFQAAPLDQRLDELHGDETIQLFGMHPKWARFETRLPGPRVSVVVQEVVDSAMRVEAISLRLDTLCIDSNRERCSLLWRGSYAVGNERLLTGLTAVASYDSPNTTSPLSATKPSDHRVTGEPLPFVAPTGARPWVSRTGHGTRSSLAIPGAPWSGIASEALRPPQPGAQTVPIDFPETELALPEPNGLLPAPVGTVPLADEWVASLVAPFPLAPAPSPDVPRKETTMDMRTVADDPSAEALPLPIETFSRVRLAIWEGSATLGEVLARHGLDEATWLAHERRYAEALRREARAGEGVLARALADANEKVRAATRESMPAGQSLDDYVALRVEIERAPNRAAVLRERGMTAAAWQHVDRSWRRRALADGAVAQALREKLAKALARPMKGKRRRSP
jgi:hypothetical protein